MKNVPVIAGGVIFVASLTPIMSTIVLGIGSNTMLMTSTIIFGTLAGTGALLAIVGCASENKNDESLTNSGVGGFLLGAIPLMPCLLAGGAIGLTTQAVLPQALGGMFLAETGICSELALSGASVFGADALIALSGAVILALAIGISKLASRGSEVDYTGSGYYTVPEMYNDKQQGYHQQGSYQYQ